MKTTLSQTFGIILINYSYLNFNDKCMIPNIHRNVMSGTMITLFVR